MEYPSTLRMGIVGTALVLASALTSRAQSVAISIDTTKDRVAVSPYLYGKNNCLSDDPSHPLSAADWQFLRDAGVRLVRENGGNNATKYNWQKKLSSHPDWYNNVYPHDWDYAQQTLQQNLPGVQGMWAFQLLGKVADNPQHNFDDWGYNHSQWWSGVNQNLAGGGTLNPAGGSNALAEGNPNLYLTDTSAITSTAILDHWIRSTDLNLDRAQFRYWDMDNEPEIWSGTHDDVMRTQLSAEEFVQRYFAYAKQARARFPEIKLLGPVPANEWQWFNFGQPIVAGGRQYPWLEYFIKRIGEEQARTGIRLLDVLDVHYYPTLTDPASILQVHRIFFDPDYVSPEANGVHTVNGGWDTSINREYIFERCRTWLQQYLGQNHGVTLSVSETGLQITNAPVAAVWYASMLGEFMKHGVEVFTPWSWQPGMWEVLHLYSRYNYSTAVSAVSDDETTVSAYATVDDTSGNLTLVLVNRALTQTKTTAVSLAGTSLPNGVYPTLRLSNLPAAETFVSHTQNALASGAVTVDGNQFSLALPPLSITSVLLRRGPDVTPPSSSPSRLVNVSVRATGGAGDAVLIAGFVIGGSGSKQILLRGIGPTLRTLGVAGAMTDPILTLFDSNRTIIGSNDNWGSGASAAEIRSLSPQVGAFELDAASLDAALAPVLATGAYTAHIEAKTGGDGIALGEIYEADLASPARFVNVSARTWVGTDADNLIAGFVIAGPTAKTVLIRAVGPGLSRWVTGVLADPVVRLYQQGIAVPLYQNDDWGSTSYADQIAATAANIGAFALADGSKDAALLLTLPTGTYTAVVSGAASTTGVALVEIYEVR